MAAERLVGIAGALQIELGLGQALQQPFAAGLGPLFCLATKAIGVFEENRRAQAAYDDVERLTACDLRRTEMQPLGMPHQRPHDCHRRLAFQE